MAAFQLVQNHSNGAIKHCSDLCKSVSATLPSYSQQGISKRENVCQVLQIIVYNTDWRNLEQVYVAEP